MGINLEETQNAIQIVESIFMILAIIIGGLWAYFNFFKARIYKPRLEMEISGTPFYKDDVYYLKAMLQLKNVGLSNFVIEQKGSALIVSSYTPPNNPLEINCLGGNEVGTFSVFERHKWIEPSETVEEHKVITIPERDQIAFELHLRIVSKTGIVKKRGIEWNETRIIELPTNWKTQRRIDYEY